MGFDYFLVCFECISQLHLRLELGTGHRLFPSLTNRNLQDFVCYLLRVVSVCFDLYFHLFQLMLLLMLVLF